MRKSFIISTFFIFCILTNTAIFSATKRNAVTSKKRSTTNISGTYNQRTGTYTPSATTLNIATATAQTTSTSMTCGTPATTDNLIAKRLCATAYSKALSLYCKQTSCTSAIKVAMNLNFGIPLLSEKNNGTIPVSIDVGGTQCYGNNLDTFCSNFAEELVSGLWSLYSEQAIRQRKTCNFAKAKFTSAQNCFTYILSEKNNAGTNSLLTETNSYIDNKIESLCGRQAIIDNYNKISIDGWDEDNDSSLFNDNANAVSGKTGITSNKKLSSSVATQFANIGNANWNISGQIGKLLDLNLDFKTSTYPRELTTLVNTFITEGETACGSQFRTEMQDTSFEIENKQSNLEREIAKKGILKGLFDYSLNQASIVIGEDRANDIKDKGIIGSIAEAVKKNKEKPTYDSQEKAIAELFTTCTTRTEKEFQEEIAKILAKINLDEKDIAKNYENIANDLILINNNTQKPNNITIPEKDDKDLILNLKKTISQLEKAKYTCPGGFKEKPKQPEKKPTYDSQEEAITKLFTTCTTKTEKEFKEEVSKILDKINLDEDNETIATNYENIAKDLTQIKNQTANKKELQIPDANAEDLTTKLKNIVNELKKDDTTYTCADGFKTEVANANLIYNIEYSTPASWDAEHIKQIRKEFYSDILERYTEENTENWTEIQAIKSIIENFEKPS